LNLSARSGCAALGLFAPGVRSFTGEKPLAERACGGYFTFTPGPNRGGTYSLRVSARPGTEAIVSYHLEVAPAGPDDEGPGLLLRDGERRTGALSGSGVDAVDLYRFDVPARSIVRLDFDSTARLSIALETLRGEAIARGAAGGDLAQTLAPGTYLAAVSAPPRASGSYAVRLRVRVVTRTTLTVGSARSMTVLVGQPVVLQSATTPAPPSAGRVGLRLDYDDPLSGWVFRRLWVVAPQGTVTFTPLAVGTWRVVASFYGTRGSSPSRSESVTLNVKSRY
jgi:hypothetical protein